MNKGLFVLAAAMISLAGAAFSDPGPRQISVSGVGQVASAPDMATITLGVTHEAREAADAMAATSQAVTQILDRLDTMGLEARDVQTKQFSLRPIWSNRNYDSKEQAKITGFLASNMVIVRIRDLDELGDILDAVIADGANNFNGLQFSVQEPKPLMEAARRAAVKDAMERAKLLAQSAGVTLGPILSMSERGGRQAPVMMSAARESSVPVAAGEVTLDATVEMIFQIAD